MIQFHAAVLLLAGGASALGWSGLTCNNHPAPCHVWALQDSLACQLAVGLAVTSTGHQAAAQAHWLLPAHAVQPADEQPGAGLQLQHVC
jgi:hypothetical protein